MKKIALSLIALAALSNQASATNTGPNWNYLKLDVAKVYPEIDTTTETRAYTLNVATELTDKTFLSGYYNSLTSDSGRNSEEINTTFINIGLGYKYPLSYSTTAYTVVAYKSAQSESYTDSELETTSQYGYSLEGGIKSKVSDNLELALGIEETSIEGTRLSEFKAELNYMISNNVSLGVGYRKFDNNESRVAVFKMNF